tara:strand:+ start:295 stop:396 length:102 start_codon:yes stop_codon:yes gene_type:complete
MGLDNILISIVAAGFFTGILYGIYKLAKKPLFG